MIQTQSEPQIFIKLKPDSLYRSFTTLDVEIYPNQKLNSCSLIFSYECDNDIISVEIENKFLKTFSSKKVILHNLKNEKINFKLKIDNAVEDSGDIKFPLILTKLQMKFSLEVKSKTLVDETPYYNIRVQTLIPKDCKGYDDNSSIKIGTRLFDKEHKLILLTDGYPKTNISYYTQNVRSEQNNTEVEIETYYFPAPLPFIPSLLIPPMVGLLILAILTSDLALKDSYPIIISIFAIYSAIWYKVVPIGMKRVPSYLNGYYIFWILISIFFAAIIEALKIYLINIEVLKIYLINNNTLIFLIYLILTIPFLYIFYRFYHHPTRT